MTCTSADISAVSAQIPTGAVSPYAIRYDVTSSDPEIDLSTIVSARFEVERQSGKHETWTALIDSGTQTAAYLRVYRTLEEDDIPKAELIKLYAVLVGPAAQEYFTPAKLIEVQDPFTV